MPVVAIVERDCHTSNHMAENTIAMWISNDGSLNSTGVHHGPRFPNHMAFYWGHAVEVLFKGWPGRDKGMYALALVFVFFLALLVECLTYTMFVKHGSNKVAAGLFRTGLYTVRTGMNYMVMLAVISYNGGIFLAAVAGHAVGYLLFGSRVFRRKSTSGSSPGKKSANLPPL
ncbi:copper transporter 4-like [Punica granatum]|uniref:Copper transport protein n=2 Tax=Punica granatum TaxID=22663 RepID=A0A218XAP6_PUNGR|nr:copper transporter 4-like [Punica granatum]OWM81769.1 hypothetical protein CDL15_Pgr007807 [Punica granatum]PKI43418.1 hypothetical protein CRG98_036175 [Punica granatum]